LSENFGHLEQELAHFTRAIGHPARVAVLLAIAKQKKEVEGEVIDVPPLSKSTVIQHLRELKRAGLINGRIFGTKSKYWIDEEKFQRFKTLFAEFIESVEAEQEKQLRS
jgi:ArsR family transcriptional regulator